MMDSEDLIPFLAVALPPIVGTAIGLLVGNWLLAATSTAYAGTVSSLAALAQAEKGSTRARTFLGMAFTCFLAALVLSGFL